MPAKDPSSNARTCGEAWRLFVALRLPEKVRATLAQAQQELRALISRASASWPRPDHLHLTLRFLGDVDCRQIDDLGDQLRAPVGMYDPITIRCERLGCFPGWSRPKVIWAWAHDEEERLTALQRMIEIVSEPFTQQPVEARFVGHITLARVKRCERSERDRIVSFVKSAVGCEFGSWTATEVELIRSELSSAGSRYTTLARIPLHA